MARDVQIFGAGIAGASAAHAFAEAGHDVVVIAPHGVARGASGIQAAVVRPRLWLASPSRVPDAEIIAHAFRFTIAWLQRHGGDHYRRCGVMLAASNDDHAQALRMRAANPATADIVRYREAPKASELAGIDLPFGGAWIESGGICDLAGLSHHLLRHPRIEIVQHEPTASPDLTICATGHAAEHASVPVRGQALAVRWPSARSAPRSVICTSGYLTPPDDDGIAWLGATYDREDRSSDVREADDARVLNGFAPLPHVHAVLANCEVVARFASVRHTTRDRLPLVGVTRSATTLASLAHGSRGAVTAPWAAQQLLACAVQQQPELPADHWLRLAPGRHARS